MKTTLMLLPLLLLTGCTVMQDKVLVTTSTILGFELAQNPANQMYQLKFGYARMELALVPTNGVNVLTEIQFKDITGRGGLYQRMAVGTEAVKQSMFMFAKDATGNINSQAVNAILQATRQSTNNTP